jgi:hypothetical protein
MNTIMAFGDRHFLVIGLLKLTKNPRGPRGCGGRVVMIEWRY